MNWNILNFEKVSHYLDIDSFRKLFKEGGPPLVVAILAVTIFVTLCLTWDNILAKLSTPEKPAYALVLILFALLLIFGIIAIVSLVYLIRDGRKPPEVKPPLMIREGNPNEFCEVHHKYIEEKYSEEATKRANIEESQFIFTVCGFSPKALMEMIARKLEVSIDDVRSWGDSADSFIDIVNAKYGGELFPHFKAFIQYASENPLRIIRVLLLSRQREYDGNKEDFVRFQWLNRSVPCYIVFRNERKLSGGIYNFSDYVIFFEDERITGLNNIKNLLASSPIRIKSDLILQYHSEAKTLLASRLVPEHTKIDYYDFCSLFLNNQLSLKPLQEYMMEKSFGEYPVETQQRYNMINSIIQEK